MTKLEWDQLNWEVYSEVVKAAMFGNQKPGKNPDDWKAMPGKFDYAFPKIMRHLIERKLGKMRDDESGLNPLAHLIRDAEIALYGDIHDKDTV